MIDEETKSMINTLVMLRRLGFRIHGVLDIIDDDNINKMIKMLKQPKVGEWIKVSDRLPENEKTVEITFKRIGYLDKKPHYLTARAFYTDGKTLRDNSAYNWEFDDVDMEYDEEHDDYLVPCGWWEAVEWGENFSVVDDFVIAWRPIGEPYKEGDN